MFLILALLAHTSPACGVVRLQAAEGANVTLQWDRPSSIELSTLILYCFLTTSPQRTMLEVLGGRLIPGPSAGQFSGRVLWDRGVLGLGQIRIVLTRISARDEGLYRCYMFSNYHPRDVHWGHNSREYFLLTVTRDKKDSEDEPREATGGFPVYIDPNLGLAQKVILFLMFGVMTLVVFCFVIVMFFYHCLMVFVGWLHPLFNKRTCPRVSTPDSSKI